MLPEHKLRSKHQHKAKLKAKAKLKLKLKEKAKETASLPGTVGSSRIDRGRGVVFRLRRTPS